MIAVSQPRRAAAASSSRNLGYVLVAVAATGWGTWPLILRHAAMAAALQSALMMIVLMAVSFLMMLRDRVPVVTAALFLGARASGP